MSSYVNDFCFKGSLELASAGVSISIFNIISKVFNIPLLSVATSFVAEDISKHSSEGFTSGKTRIFTKTTFTFYLAIVVKKDKHGKLN